MGAIAVLGTRANAVRRVITAKGGQTTSDGIRSMVRNDGSDEPLWDKAAAAFGRLKGWVTEKASNWLANISFRAVLGLVVATVQFILNFNFNTSDEEFEAAIKARELAWYGQLGETLGTFAGWLVCGVVPSLLIGTVNEGLMMHLLLEVGEEAFDEVGSELQNLLLLGMKQHIQNLASRMFMGLRSAIKTAANQKDQSLIGKGVQAMIQQFPGLKPIIENWGKKGAKSWTIAGSINEWVESFPDGNLQEFLEEFIDAFGESCVEAGYVVAGGIDSWILNQKVAHDQIQGKLRVVEVLLDRSDPDSKVIVAGPERQVMQTLIEQKNQYMQMKRHDMGLIVGGEPVANTITTPGLPYARIIFSNSDTKKVKPTYIDIHNLDRTKWDNWAAIKLACGGSNGYTWGAYWVEALLPDNNVIGCYAGSENEGENMIERLLPFSMSGDDLTKIQWNARHEMRKGSRTLYDSTYKSSRKQVPWEFIIVNPQRILNEENGRANRSGIYQDRQAVIPLWTDTAPDDFAETIAELFRTPGPNP